MVFTLAFPYNVYRLILYTTCMMRKEPFTTDNFVHIYTRGNRKQDIVREKGDWWHFLKMLFYLNSELPVANPSRVIQKIPGVNSDTHVVKTKSFFEWPTFLPKRKPIVKILAFVLMENHFHLLLKEIREGGISLFMRKLCTSLAMHFNKRHGEVGRLFQSSYRAKRVDSDEYLSYLTLYIQLKNTFQRYPEGFISALEHFDKAFQWAVEDPFTSLGDYAGIRSSPIIDKDILATMFPTPESYKRFAHTCFLQEQDWENKINHLLME